MHVALHGPISVLKADFSFRVGEKKNIQMSRGQNSEPFQTAMAFRQKKKKKKVRFVTEELPVHLDWPDINR